MLERDWRNDWRNRGQESYLYGIKLCRRKYTAPTETWTHDHCEFCWARFSESEDDLNYGYVASEENWWICDECFADLQSIFKWSIINSD